MFNKDNLHHAYVLEGDREVGMSIVRNFLKDELGISLKGNVDLFERMYEGFGITDAREIKDVMLEKAISEYKIFILALSTMTNASANALLKSLEEPTKGTHFFIIVPNSKRLIDTLLSRIVLIKLPKQKDEVHSLLVTKPKEFLSLSKPKRQEEIKKILSLYDKENISKLEIQSYFRNILDNYRNIPSYDKESLKRSILALDYMSDQSSSVKIIIEYISLIL